MKSLKTKNIVLLITVCTMTLGCVTLQQPLPGSLWGDWAFVKTGTITTNGNERLFNYRHVCNKESDRLSFRSDKKMSLRWYDNTCMINYYFIGRYHVENNILIVDLEDNKSYQDNPFPPISKYRISQINQTTLKLEEITDSNRTRRIRTNTVQEPLVFIFMRID
ncbi:hypothetical protein BZARG_2561 [Bizionia argentinensis JUB59]|uniref:Lipocalin-like domain-containing protein n=1 Tax=Bizionia argentinensis JUB59 TaxID=1046627 RepID=G2EGU4_9FLAO|nr:lipocalin family protein [Bizionia argentinensis]EGV42341.1 hypothetical protein BZARG_2561 [Bizionia argentinensis JUB59]